MEAEKSWLYAIAASIVIGLYQLFFSASAASTKTLAERDSSQQEETIELKPTDEKKPLHEMAALTTKQDEQNQAVETDSKIYRQLVIDCCDIFIPGASVGWIPVSNTVVGTAQFISTILAGQLIWKRVQAAK